MDLMQRLDRDIQAEAVTFLMVNKDKNRVSYRNLVSYITGQLNDAYQTEWQKRRSEQSFRQNVVTTIVPYMLSKGYELLTALESFQLIDEHTQTPNPNWRGFPEFVLHT